MRLGLLGLGLPAGGLVFNPLSFFADGTNGVLFDLSDASTVFSDAIGTTAASVDGALGLLLDKSRGLTLGSELVTNGDFVSAAGWTLGTGCTISGGKLNCATAASPIVVYSSISPAAASRWFKCSWTIDSRSAGDVVLRLFSGGSSVVVNGFAYQSAAGTFTAYVLTNAAPDRVYLQLGGSGFTGVIDNITVKEVAGNHAYQATSGAKPVWKTSAGKYFALFDGSDDGLATAAVDLSGTDKVTVFVGVRKLSDVAGGLALESSDAGRFTVLSPRNSGSKGHAFQSRGLGGSSDAVATGASFDAPVTSVLTGIGDISGDSAIIRVNGAQQAQATTDQGTGNYSNTPVYIGRRSDTTLPFNGQIFALCIVGRACTASEIAAMENWINQRTGAF